MQDKFKIGDIVFLMSSSQDARTITEINSATGMATVTWVARLSSALMSSQLPLDALYLSPTNPRTSLKIGNIVSYTKHDDSIIYMVVHAFDHVSKESQPHNVIVTCQWFEKNKLCIQEFYHSQLTKVFHRFEGLNVTIVDDKREMEQHFLGNYLDYQTFKELFDTFDLPLSSFKDLYNELDKEFYKDYSIDGYNYTFIRTSLNKESY